MCVKKRDTRRLSQPCYHDTNLKIHHKTNLHMVLHRPTRAPTATPCHNSHRPHHPQTTTTTTTETTTATSTTTNNKCRRRHPRARQRRRRHRPLPRPPTATRPTTRPKCTTCSTTRRWRRPLRPAAPSTGRRARTRQRHSKLPRATLRTLRSHEKLIEYKNKNQKQQIKSQQTTLLITIDHVFSFVIFR